MPAVPTSTALTAIAARVRDAGLDAAGRPGTITYSRKVFVPLTRLCRDRCHYCTFATTPAKVPAPYLSIDEVVDIARRGAALGCKEALFTLGDRPEARWPQAAQWLEEAGYGGTLDYVRAAAIAVLEETGLLPHLNPGVMSWEELQRLKPVAPSMGMMLETTADVPAHRRQPGQGPGGAAARHRGRRPQRVAFTTGILVGIGETPADRVESLFAIRGLARQYRHVQEVLVQNFRAKPDTAMRARRGRGPRRLRRDDRRRPAAARPVGADAGAAQPRRRRRTSPGCSPPASTTSAASPRSPPTTSTRSGRGRTSTRSRA